MTAIAHAIRVAAAPWAPLLELTKPRLSMLVLFTALAGYVAGDGPAIPARILALLMGTALVAGGANALNQVLERDADGRMDRTRGRPLPSGRLTPTEAIRFAALLATVGLVQLLIGTNLLTAFLGAAAIAAYALVYTPLKRVTVHNTLVGAVVGAIPPMMGWAAARGRLDAGAWMLGAILFVWQLPHFFAIAWIYRDDYSRGGFRMLSVLDDSGGMTTRQVAILAWLLVPLSLIPVVLGLTGPVYAWSAPVMSICFAICSVWVWPDRRMAHARVTFIASVIYLPLLLAVYMADLR